MENNNKQQEKAKHCAQRGGHFPLMRKDIGICHFSNTGKPYIIEQCGECKSEYVRELRS